MTFANLAVIALIGVMIVALLLAAMIIFGTAKPKSAGTEGADAIAVSFPTGLPPVESVTARDGTALAFRFYRGDGDIVAILVHGSVGAGATMHFLAEAIRARGGCVYAPDIRGHGASGTPGDIAYAGQLEDDLADLTAEIRRRHPGKILVLAGYSSGGGYVLRVAGGSAGHLFDRFVLISPYLGHRAPTQRPDHHGWVVPFVPRIIGLSVLERLGIHWFEGLPAIAFAPGATFGVEPSSVAGAPMTNSYRLSRNFHPGADVAGDFRRTAKPMTVIVGSADEVFYADRFAPLIQRLRPDIAVTLVPGQTHLDMIRDPRGTGAVAAVIAPDARPVPVGNSRPLAAV